MSDKIKVETCSMSRLLYFVKPWLNTTFSY
jgi:hypothetical protein